jgi:hypothetical protein
MSYRDPYATFSHGWTGPAGTTEPRVSRDDMPEQKRSRLVSAWLAYDKAVREHVSNLDELADELNRGVLELSKHCHLCERPQAEGDEGRDCDAGWTCSGCLNQGRDDWREER